MRRPLSSLSATLPPNVGTLGAGLLPRTKKRPQEVGGAVTITAKDGGMQASAKDGSESQVTEGVFYSIALRSVALGSRNDTRKQLSRRSRGAGQ